MSMHREAHFVVQLNSPKSIVSRGSIISMYISGYILTQASLISVDLAD